MKDSNYAKSKFGIKDFRGKQIEKDFGKTGLFVFPTFSLF